MKPSVIQDDYGFVGATGPTGAKGETGEGIHPAGAWIISRQYNVGDVVSYKGGSWIAVEVSAGRLPSHSKTWMLLAAKGEQGPAGVGQRGRRGADGASGSGGAVVQIPATFDQDTTLGQVVYLHTTGNARLALANDPTTSQAIGFASVDVLSGQVGEFQTEGVITLGGSLIPGRLYFLSADTPGGITLIAPTIVGEFVCPVGRAVSSTTLDIEIQTTILL